MSARYCLTAVLVGLVSVHCLALDVLVNHAGYEPNGPKIVRAQRGTDFSGDGTFSVKQVSDNSIVYSGTLTHKGGLWDKFYWEGDFSSLKTCGDCYISATVNGESGTSFSFTVAPDALLNKTGKLVYQYFTAQRCGASVSLQYVNRSGSLVTWSHNLCHTDDGYLSPSGPYLDTAGGWHDSGEYQKYPQFFGGNPVLDLLVLYDYDRSYYDAIDADSNGIPDIVDEALWETRWLAKMVQPNGHVMKQISKRRSGASWVKPESDTDRVIGTSDDRWVEIGNENNPQETVVCASLIRMHRVLASKGLPTENFADKALAIWNHRVALAISEGGHNNLGSGAHQLWAALDLYAVFGLQDCWDRGLQKVDEMANGAINNPAVYDEAAETAGYELGALAWFVLNYPSTTKTDLARTAVQVLMDHNLTLADDPVGLIRRLESGQFQYFPANPNLGLNRLYGTVAWAATESYKIIGNPSYLRFALDQYNWILGANYHRVCMMEAAGDYHVNKYHSRYDTFIANGIEPGVVMNGYIRDANGLPWVDFGTGSVSAQTNESWLPNSAAYALGLAGLTVFRDNAQYISDTIPATMIAGVHYGVSVTMKNTSSMTWDSTNYKLGAVGDSDPFTGGRQSLPAGTTVAPGQQYTFTFTMTAPSTPGTYTTDWRMMQESVNWFGDTLTRTVQVGPDSAPEPVTNFVATPGTRQIALSWQNPPSSVFTGTVIRFSTIGYPGSPAGGLLLIDKSNTPGSSDSIVHTNLTPGVRYYYTAFAHNVVPTYSVATTATAIPLSAKDFDRDGDVDQSDFGHLQTCVADDGIHYAAGCSDADFNADGDVDASDVVTFLPCLGGASRPPGS